jgi:DmsE family decaheme c-type cytochrome
MRQLKFLTASTLVAVYACLLVSASANPAAQKEKPAQAPNGSDLRKRYVRPTDPALYVGAETCKTCHEDIYNQFETTPHVASTMEAKLEGYKGPEWHGCEACHGPGKEHVDGGGDKTKIFTFKDASPQETSARCLGCHQYTEEHANYERSAHLMNGVGCIDCHSPHHPKEGEFLLKAKAPELCYGCHGDVRAQFARPFHHRVPEGLLTCNDCHSPHGTFRPKQLRTNAAGDTVCYKCHFEKQGPYVYQHEALVEGCTICHSPHGSTNQRFLVQNQVNLLCLSCHVFPAEVGPPATPTFHNQATTKYQSCTLCHTAIHGSNTSVVFFTP